MRLYRGTWDEILAQPQMWRRQLETRGRDEGGGEGTPRRAEGLAYRGTLPGHVPNATGLRAPTRCGSALWWARSRSGIDQHHGLFRFSWVMVDPQEQQLQLEGMDFVELAADGGLQRITGFFGAFPPIPESWPEHLVWRGG